MYKTKNSGDERTLWVIETDEDGFDFSKLITDAELAKRIAALLNWSSFIPTEDIENMLQGGYTLWDRFILMDKLIYNLDQANLTIEGLAKDNERLRSTLFTLQEQRENENKQD